MPRWARERPADDPGVKYLLVRRVELLAGAFAAVTSGAVTLAVVLWTPLNPNGGGSSIMAGVLWIAVGYWLYQMVAPVLEKTALRLAGENYHDRS